MIDIITYNAIEGFHRYPDAPDFCSYLAARHRHVFVIRCRFTVYGPNRQIEINQRQLDIYALLTQTFGAPCEFHAMSCEMIAEFISDVTGAEYVEVLEDGYGGASFSR